MNRILVIEDEPDIQEVLRNYLQASGYAVLVAGDGERGGRGPRRLRRGRDGAPAPRDVATPDARRDRQLPGRGGPASRPRPRPAPVDPVGR